jgi:RNA polymerase sigma-70 factor (ECF subfamily)
MAPLRATSPSHSTTLASYDEREWIARIRAGDHAAFEKFVRHYSDRLCAFVHNIVLDVEVTKELVQDVFLWVWRHREEWEVRTGLTSYVYRAARNRALSHLRRNGRELRWQEELARGDGQGECADRARSDDGTNAADLSAAIDRAVASLPPRCREVFTLNRQHRLSYREIAETLEISVKTVEVHMARALVAMRRHLVDWIE